MTDLSPAMIEMLEAIRDGGGRVSVNYNAGSGPSGRFPGRFHISTRRGWGSRARLTWEALVKRGLVRKTEDYDHLGRWWELAD